MYKLTHQDLDRMTDLRDWRERDTQAQALWQQIGETLKVELEDVSEADPQYHAWLDHQVELYGKHETYRRIDRSNQYTIDEIMTEMMAATLERCGVYCGVPAKGEEADVLRELTQRGFKRTITVFLTYLDRFNPNTPTDALNTNDTVKIGSDIFRWRVAGFEIVPSPGYYRLTRWNDEDKYIPADYWNAPEGEAVTRLPRITALIETREVTLDGTQFLVKRLGWQLADFTYEYDFRVYEPNAGHSEIEWLRGLRYGRVTSAPLPEALSSLPFYTTTASGLTRPNYERRESVIGYFDFRRAIETEIAKLAFPENF